jgi:hypothetical protein
MFGAYWDDMMNIQVKSVIEQVMDAGIRQYIQTRHDKVDSFVKTHFSMKSALKLHRKALGGDLYRVPLNIAWAAPYLVVRISSSIMRRTGMTATAKRLGQMPAGFKTNVQKEVEWLLHTELLELPYKQENRSSQKDMLLISILQQEMISSEIQDALQKIGTKVDDPDFRNALEKKLVEYGTSRTAVSELTGSLLMLASGYLTWQKATPGVITGGSAVAAAIANQMAISNFWLGSFLGSIYYTLFPAAPSLALVAAATGSLMAGMAVASTFAGILVDPLQAKLGIHHKRLHKLISALAKELTAEAKSDFKLREIYLARIFDFMDLLKTASRLI